MSCVPLAPFAGARAIRPRAFGAVASRRVASARATVSRASDIIPGGHVASRSIPARRPRRGGRDLAVAARGPGGAEDSRAPDPGSGGSPRGRGDDGEQFRRWLLETELPKTGKSALRSLSSLPLAIGEFLVIAGFSALGTVIEQNKGAAWYVQNYPVESPAFGFIDYPFILDLGLDHIYTEWYFLALLGALAASLTACTFTRQLPVWRVAPMEVPRPTRHAAQDGGGGVAPRARARTSPRCSLDEGTRCSSRAGACTRSKC